jgi:hypothetical protein
MKVQENSLTQTNWQTDKQTNRQTDKLTNRQTDKQTNWQTDKLTIGGGVTSSNEHGDGVCELSFSRQVLVIQDYVNIIFRCPLLRLVSGKSDFNNFPHFSSSCEERKSNFFPKISWSTHDRERPPSEQLSQVLGISVPSPLPTKVTKNKTLNSLKTGQLQRVFG